MLQSTSLAELPWAPTLDTNKDSIYPDYASKLYAKGRFARLPFIAGNNLDEGMSPPHPRPACFSSGRNHAGTLFASRQERSDTDFKNMIIAQHSPPTTTQEELEDIADKILELYPDNPAAGSPYGTGDELFGMPRSYKREAALSAYSSYMLAICSTDTDWIQWAT